MNRPAQPLSDADVPFYLSRQSLLLIATITFGLGLVGTVIGAVRSSDLGATASVTLETPRPIVLTEPISEVEEVDLETFVDTQMDVLDSQEVARRTATILEGAPYSPSPSEVQAATDIQRLPNSAQVEVTYSAAEEADAVAGANGVIEAYEDLMRQRWADRHSAAIASVRETLETVEADTEVLLTSVAERLSAFDEANGDEEVSALSQELREIISELATIDQAVADGASGEVLDALEVRGSLLASQIDAFQSVFAEETEGTGLSVDASRLESALLREEQLRERLVELELDSRFEAYGVAFTTPAVSATRSAAGPMLAGLAGLVLGACLALAIVYWRQRYGGRIGSPAEALRLLGYPQASKDASSEEARRDSPVEPVDGRYDISKLLAHIRSGGLQGQAQVLGLVGEEEIASTAIELATACADDGHHVLVIDGALSAGSQSDGLVTSLGLGDFIGAELPIESVIEERRSANDSTYHVLGYGETGLIDVLHPDDLRRALILVERSYEVVLVALPPSSLSGLLDNGYRGIQCVVVVSHESQLESAARLLQEIKKRQVETLGFLYPYEFEGESPKSERISHRHRSKS